MPLKKPKNKKEEKLYREQGFKTYEQELIELFDKHPSLIDLYYDSHMGCWVLQTDNIDQEFDTKSGALYHLAKSSLD